MHIFKEQQTPDVFWKTRPAVRCIFIFSAKKIKDAASIGAKTSFCFSSEHSEILKYKIFCGY